MTFDQCGNSAVIWATSSRQKNVLRELVEPGADINIKENVQIECIILLIYFSSHEFEENLIYCLHH